MRKFLVGAALLFAVVSVPAQQMVTETFDPAQPQDADFAKSVKEWTTQPYFISPLVDHLPLVKGIPSPKAVLGYHIGAPYKLTYYADILKYYRALAAATPRVKVETIGKSDEGRELVVVWVSSDENIKNVQKNRDNLAKIADPRGLTPDADQDADPDDQAALPPDGRSPQRRDGAVRDADGADLPARDRDVAAHQADPRERHRVDHAGRRSRTAATATSTGSTRGSTSRPPIRRRRQRLRRLPERPGPFPPELRRSRRGAGAAARRCRTGASTCSTTTTATSTSRRSSMRALVDWYFTALSADHARPARVAAAPLYLQRRRAAESESRSDPVHRAAVLLELRAAADDEVRDARRLHARVHGRLVAGLSRVGRLQPQRHDADVRDAVRPRERSRPRRAPAARSGGDSAGDDARRRRRAATTPPAHGAANAAPPATAQTPGRGGSRPRSGWTRPRRARTGWTRRRGCGAGAEGGAAGGGRASRAGWWCARRRARLDPDRTRRRTAARVVPRAAGSAGRGREFLATEQHELHADGRPLGPAAHRHVSQHGGRQLLSEDTEVDRGRQDRSALRLRDPGGQEGHDARGRRWSTSCARSASRSARRTPRSRSAATRSPPART